MTVLVPKVEAPAPALASQDRDWLKAMLGRMASASALFDTGYRRYDREATINVAERGTFGYIPAKGFTFTDTGSIFIREEVLVGMLAEQYTASQVLGQLTRGDIVDPTRWLNQDVVREVLAAYGVVGHEFGHLAGSEHAGRKAWQMVLEDLRIESMWLDADPIRARQALRACAEHWVAQDISPTEAAKTGRSTTQGTIDPSQYRTKADVLHAYLLFVGRARIGVLQDESVLVDGVRRVASQVLGFDLLVEADEIIDRYLETARDHEDPDGIRERAALAKRMAALVKDEPRPKGGCFHGPKSDAEPGEGGDDSEPGEGEPGGSEDGEGDSDSDTEDGEGEGEGEGEGSEKGDSGSDSDGEEGEGEGSGSDGEDGEGEGDSDSDGGDSDGEGDSDGGEEGKPGGEGGKGERSGGGAGFESLTEGAAVKGKVRPTDDGYKGEAAEDATAQGGHERIDGDTAKALAEALQKGLHEVNDPNSEAGWAISEEDALTFAVDRTPAKRISQEVFNPRQRATRNRRIR